MTQAQMAKIMGTAQDMISRFENAERLPTLGNWLSFARAMEIDPYLPLEDVEACGMPKSRINSHAKMQD
jgi:hypothetical protein